MKLFNQLDLNIDNPQVISFVGGGGKTTSIKTLAKELANQGSKVLITTTTMIFDSMKNQGNDFFLKDIPRDFKANEGTITILGEATRDDKLVGCSVEKIDEIKNRNLFDFILIEADGAKRKPIKAPEAHEPVICNSTSITIGLIGIDAIGLEINQANVHRAERLEQILDVNQGHIIDYNDLVNLALHAKGIFKSSKGKKILLVNKIRSNKDIEIGRQIRDKLKGRDIKIVIGDIINKLYY